MVAKKNVVLPLLLITHQEEEVEMTRKTSCERLSNTKISLQQQ